MSILKIYFTTSDIYQAFIYANFNYNSIQQMKVQNSWGNFSTESH